ncbi:MAG: 4-hydroxythreonine-4-phosphate dehydrogenase PdxA [Caulobacter sp.]|nr:4-hydroxythreonine-4-phosphate dehydrogenase PdxA [Caulobacter sp.]
MNRLPLALTLGDPAGIGPEIVGKAWRARTAGDPGFFVLGDAEVIRSAAGSGILPVAVISHPSQAMDLFDQALPVLHQPLIRPPVPGAPDPAHASAILGWIEQAVALTLAGEASGIVTAPIAKASLYAAGFPHPGHTEFLAALTAEVSCTGPRGPVMMLATEGLRVCLATIHMPLSRVSEALNLEGLIRSGEIIVHALRRDFGIASPRLAVAGLNPHAGEGGTIGREEIDIIVPAVAALAGRGLDVIGPVPADSLFHPTARERYDAVLCMYHDQGLIPLKMLDFWGGVNITLGLPVVRTSPDHGTGFDIAGRGVARPDSLIQALRMAAKIAERRTGK